MRVTAGIHQKAVFWLVIVVLTQISPSRFKQSKISSSRITTFRAFFENVLVIFGIFGINSFSQRMSEIYGKRKL